MATYLDRILRWHRERAGDPPGPDEIERVATLAPVRPFATALRGADHLAVIAEIKRRSPSKGALNPDLDPAEMAVRYATAGASCLSVLTDTEHFGGSEADLRAARSAVDIPVLRKDFTVCAADVVTTRAMGADCILLIAAALDPEELRSLHDLARTVGLSVLIEVHDEAELGVALALDPEIVGVNQRDLVTFEVDHDRAARLASLIPDGVVRVAESGVRNGEDARRLRDAGYHAVLVGESLVTAPDVGAAVRELLV